MHFVSRVEKIIVQNCVYKFIQVCMEPARGLNTQSAYEKRRFEINRVLMLKGIEIRDDGNFYKITKAESLSEVERRTRELKINYHVMVHIKEF